MQKLQATNSKLQQRTRHDGMHVSTCDLRLATLNQSNTKGFTLIEMMISVAIFTVVMIYGVGSLLSSNQNYRQTENLRKAIDNLSFTMEDMARTLRVGTNYVCGGTFVSPGGANPFPDVLGTDDIGEIGFGGSHSCPYGGGSVMFESAEGDPDPLATDDQYGYLILYNDDQAKLYKTTDGGEHWLISTPPSVILDPLASGFYVTGADTTTGSPSDVVQPAVMIHLSGVVTYRDIETRFNLQTTVSQRALDQ